MHRLAVLLMLACSGSAVHRGPAPASGASNDRTPAFRVAVTREGLMPLSPTVIDDGDVLRGDALTARVWLESQAVIETCILVRTAPCSGLTFVQLPPGGSALHVAHLDTSRRRGATRLSVHASLVPFANCGCSNLGADQARWVFAP